MRFTFSVSIALALLAAGMLAGCQSEAPTAAPGPNANRPAAEADRQAYTRELLALKATAPDQKALEAEHLGLLAKYGYALPEAESAPAEAAPVMAKTAATLTEVLAKQSTGSIYRTYRNSVLVPNGAKLFIHVSGQGAADPYLVAYYRTTVSDVKYVIVNDDSSTGVSLNPKGEWVNKTGSEKEVFYTLFAALNTARGLADMFVQVGGSGTPGDPSSGTTVTVSGIRVGGTVKYENDFPSDPAPGCLRTPQSRFALQVNSGSNSVQLLAFNSALLRGIEGNAKTAGVSLNSPWIPPGTQKGTTPSKKRHFVLASSASTTFGSPTIAGGFTYSQFDIHSCP
jgi:hypothetical protein